jgi:hypothetical protein
MNTIAKFCAALALMLAVVSTAAQAADPQPCSKAERGNQTLSEKLGQTNGVICPPDVDPAIKAPTPNGGSIPVIPPPGSPGGSPNVEPK